MWESAIAPPCVHRGSFFSLIDPSAIDIPIRHIIISIPSYTTCNMQHDAIRTASLSLSPSTTHNISMLTDGFPGRLFGRVLFAQL
jgi:hypothetical protein